MNRTPAKIIAGLAATAAVTGALAVAGTGIASADSYTGNPGHALTSTAECRHDDGQVKIKFDHPTVYAQPDYLPGEHQTVRYRTVVVDVANGDIIGVSNYESAKATVDKAADLDTTDDVKVASSDSAHYVAIQQVEWLASNQQTVVGTTDLYATAYEVKDGRTLLGTFDTCQ
ncbi:hypothetical protein [Antrihabitans cavernicola]|uniref:Uncharacterized protein n=1 Tax=Antrihabitans cavernicola TaxID=2495913 RepID=A0A5A7S6C6_9NOCA|nr:hypothetical protein [Spelaeibacter cavernicola]KAA0018990.1 hypothetical protein FOY51_23450 [Spelaeibacter cavernicola]